MKIEISDSDFARLQRLAVPLVDSPASVIAKLLDMAEQDKTHKSFETEESEKKLLGLSFEIPPLTHAKLLDASFSGEKPDKYTWDGLLRLAIKHASRKAKNFDDLRKASGARMVMGEKHDEGYKYLPELGLSYQGVSADDAMKIVTRINEFLWTECTFEFEWRKKEGAAMPGKTARGHIGGGLVKVTWSPD